MLIVVVLPTCDSHTGVSQYKCPQIALCSKFHYVAKHHEHREQGVI